MSVAEINTLAKNLALRIVDDMKSGVLPKHKINLGDNGDIDGYPEGVFNHSGIYGFSIEKEHKVAITYIGKSEGGNRLKQHLTGKNRNGSQLKPSVKHKNENIKDAIRNGYTVCLCLYVDSEFEKSSLSCVEIAASLYARECCSVLFPKFEHWNKRIG